MKVVSCWVSEVNCLFLFFLETITIYAQKQNNNKTTTFIVIGDDVVGVSSISKAAARQLVIGQFARIAATQWRLND